MTTIAIQEARRLRLKADLMLLLVTVIWGGAFAAQRVVAQSGGVFLFNGVRFWLGALALLPLARRAAPERLRLRDLLTPELWVLGGLLFAGAGLQQLGMRYTTAGNAGFFTALYVIFIPIILALVWRQLPPRLTWAAALLAVAGMFLLSTGGQLAFNPGDLIELGGALVWAFHVILLGRFVQNGSVMRLAVGQYLVCGLFNLLVGIGVEFNSAALGILAVNWWAILYTGLFSVGLGYTLQALAQKVAPAADAAIILSMEAVFAALFGWVWLGERLNQTQLLGCGLILLGLLLAQLKDARSK
jgi:drug/metabolite transporter (DMT)-like permease